MRHSIDIGLLVLRLGIGVMFFFHGLPKIMNGIQNGPIAWQGLAQYGLPFLPDGVIAIGFGLAAALAECLGGVLLAIGYLQRLACLALMATMAVAFSVKLGEVTGIGDFAKTAGWPLELLFVLIALFICGPGRYRIGRKTE